MIIGLAVKALLGFGLSERVAKVLAPILVVALVVALLWGAAARIRADGYRDGERATDAKWVAASNRLKAQAEKSGQQADVNAAGRAHEFTARLAEEKEKVDEAVENGADPFGELFPSGVRP